MKLESAYYYNLNGANHEPLDISNGVEKITADENACISNFCNPPCKSEAELDQIKNDFFTNLDLYSFLKADYYQSPTPEKEEGLAYYQAKMDADAYLVILHELHDSIDFNNDTLRIWMENINNLAADLWLASDYIRTGESDQAIQLIDAIPAKHQLDSLSQASIQGYKSVLNYITDGQYALNDSIKHVLTIYANSNGYTAGLARNILTWYGTHFPPTYNIQVNQNRGIENDQNEISLGRSVVIIPNPTKGPVTLYLNLPENAKNVSLNIIDINGKLVRHYEPSTFKGVVNLTLETEGMYFYQLTANDRIFETGKIVVQR